MVGIVPRCPIYPLKYTKLGTLSPKPFTLFEGTRRVLVMTHLEEEASTRAWARAKRSRQLRLVFRDLGFRVAYRGEETHENKVHAP